MSADEPGLPKFCHEAQSQLPGYINGELTGWPARVVRSHLKHCEDCSAEAERQRGLSEALTALRDRPPAPPDGLLDDLLAISANRGIRERAAAPARGAISGARPALSVGFLTVGAVASTGVGWTVWRLFRRLRPSR